MRPQRGAYSGPESVSETFEEFDRARYDCALSSRTTTGIITVTTEASSPDESTSELMTRRGASDSWETRLVPAGRLVQI